MLQQLFDKDGRPYQLSILETDSHIFLKLRHHQLFVGEAKCVWESAQTLLLGDIAIANAVIPQPTDDFSALISTLPGGQPKPVNYRRRGLGSALLKSLIHHARTKNAQQLYGNVFEQDVQNNPKLLYWYQKHGFEIREIPEGDREDVVANIHLDLNPSS